MINTGKCPFCKEVIRRVNIEDVDIYVGFEHLWRGFSYQCSSCKSVLSVQMNPLTLNDDLKHDLLEEFKKMLH